MITYSRIDPTGDGGRREPRFADSRREAIDAEIIPPSREVDEYEYEDVDDAVVTPPPRHPRRRSGSGARLAVIVGFLAVIIAFGVLALTFGGAMKGSNVAATTPVPVDDDASAVGPAVDVTNSPDTRTTTAERVPAAEAKPVVIPPIPVPRPAIVNLNGNTATASTASPEAATAAPAAAPVPTVAPTAAAPSAADSSAPAAAAAPDDPSVDSLMADVDRIIAEEKVRGAPDAMLPGEDGVPMDSVDPSLADQPDAAAAGAATATDAPLQLDLPPAGTVAPTAVAPTTVAPTAVTPAPTFQGPVPPADIPNPPAPKVDCVAFPTDPACVGSSAPRG